MYMRSRSIEGNEYDSYSRITKIQQFLWSKAENKCINHDRSKVKWPRTQDLEPTLRNKSRFYINSRENYLKFHDRIGENPLLLNSTKSTRLISTGMMILK